MPVRPGPDGTWVVNSSEAGILGQGRTLVQREGPERPGWRLDLPAEFALTSQRPGAAHSALVDGDRVVLVGGRDGRRGPSAIAGLDQQKGRLAWRYALPEGSRVFLYESGFAKVVVARCRPGSCRLTGLDSWSGRRAWERTVPGNVRVLDGCRADGFTVGRRSASDRCRPYLVFPDRIATLDPDDGRPHEKEGLRPPAGRVDRISDESGRTIMATAPAKGSCRVTVLADGRGDIADGDRGWRHTFTWDQPQAPRDASTGCRWDRTLPLTVGFTLVLPDARGALVAHPYFGTLNPTRRLEPGEYVFTNGTMDEIIRAAGRQDRLLDQSDRPVRPDGLTPAARALIRHVWQDGRRLLLLDHENHTLWEGESSCQAFLQSDHGGVLTYCDGTDLVTLRPVEKD
ncbi:outer membrane protein assembly factor BamB family protein [Streptomyces sp. Qhu_M48]|uniref:outer membrane protein assembly factor BamB family protein n=1 Tax=Streptomyces sp. Qhu_M48 TaxID=3435889 RepID=UPI003F509C36